MSIVPNAQTRQRPCNQKKKNAQQKRETPVDPTHTHTRTHTHTLGDCIVFWLHVEQEGYAPDREGCHAIVLCVFCDAMHNTYNWAQNECIIIVVHLLCNSVPKNHRPANAAHAGWLAGWHGLARAQWCLRIFIQDFHGSRLHGCKQQRRSQSQPTEYVQYVWSFVLLVGWCWFLCGPIVGHSAHCPYLVRRTFRSAIVCAASFRNENDTIVIFMDFCLGMHDGDGWMDGQDDDSSNNSSSSRSVVDGVAGALDWTSTRLSDVMILYDRMCIQNRWTTLDSQYVRSQHTCNGWKGAQATVRRVTNWERAQSGYRKILIVFSVDIIDECVCVLQTGFLSNVWLCVCV